MVEQKEHNLVERESAITHFSSGPGTAITTMNSDAADVCTGPAQDQTHHHSVMKLGSSFHSALLYDTVGY